MPTKLSRWGNSLGLRIPRYVADCAHLQAGDVVQVRLLDSGDILIRHADAGNCDVTSLGNTERTAPLSAEKLLAEW